MHRREVMIASTAVVIAPLPTFAQSLKTHSYIAPSAATLFTDPTEQFRLRVLRKVPLIDAAGRLSLTQIGPKPTSIDHAISIEQVIDLPSRPSSLLWCINEHGTASNAISLIAHRTINLRITYTPKSATASVFEFSMPVATPSVLAIPTSPTAVMPAWRRCRAIISPDDSASLCIRDPFRPSTPAPGCVLVSFVPDQVAVNQHAGDTSDAQ